jgi:hypothetical protein
MIPRKFEHLENVVKLVRCKRYSKTTNNQVSMISTFPTIRRICINKKRKNKIFHLLVEINNYVIEELVDIRASMSIMIVAIVRELGIMHLVIEFETYKIASRVVTQAMGRINEVPVKVGGV